MNFIENLREKRLNWIKANRENGFEDGIRNLLTELYPDNAHFIYELLQNAEDAQATKVKFVLNQEGLSFLHNGRRQFSEDDIESITSIGVSTKIGDFNQIGKFGVGFKSIFSYTDTPRIYSSKFSFEIHDLVCPKSIEQLPQFINGNNNSTFFWFPFNHKEKSKGKAFLEVKETLLSLPENTILFLQNIEEISWEISDESKETGFIRRSKSKDNFFEIDKNLNKSNWLLFKKEVSGKEGLYIAIAFKLIKEKDDFKFDRKIEKGDVSIFFVAEKEISNLKFFIHAPFAATVARDSIQNKEENNDLRDLLVQLLIESLPQIKNLGMLDKNFLSILPNNKDVLSAFYNPFREKIIETLQNESFTPTWKEDYLPASKLLQATNEIKNVVNNDTILSYIIDDEAINSSLDWATNAERGSRAFSFLETLNIREVSLKEIFDKVAFTFSCEEDAEEYLSKLSDEEMQSFYSLLAKGIEANKEHFKKPQYYWDKENRIINAFIVRLQNGKHTKGEGCYFENGFVKESKELSIVKANTYEVAEDEKQNAKLFLEAVGVKTFDEKQEIIQILKKHYNDELNVTEEQNIQHIEKFVEFLIENSQEFKVFTDFHILRTENEDKSKEYYSKPSQIYLDEPFKKTGLSSIKSVTKKFGLWNGYERIKNKKRFIEFLNSVGVKHKVEIISCHPSHISCLFGNTRKTYYEMSSDFTIENLVSIISIQNVEASTLIWNILANAKSECLEARYSPNDSAALRKDKSTLVCTLTDYAWIPDENGEFHKPNEIYREQLPDYLIIDNRNGWLDAIGLLNREFFEEEKKKLTDVKTKENRLKKEKAAEELGIDLSDIEQFKKEKIEFEEYKREKRAKAERSAKRKSALNRNQIGVSNDYDFEDIDLNFKDRNRTVSSNRTSKVEEYAETKIKARNFLKPQYTNELQIVNCQICQEEMPFQTYDGEWYFIATKIIEKTNKDNVANYLCCCPNCSEMYKHANSNKDEMTSIILESDIDNCVLTLELAGNDCEIEFAQKHFEELFNFADRQNF